MKLRKDSSNDVVVYSEVSKSNYILKGWITVLSYWQISVSDGINPPVLSAIRAFTTTAFPNARFLFVKKKTIIMSFIQGCEGNKLLTNSSISWRPRKIIKLKKSHLLEQWRAKSYLYHESRWIRYFKELIQFLLRI
jgi:hypothetical protein